MVQRNELAPLTAQEDFDFHVEDKIVRNTVEPMKKCLAALARVYERKLWRGRFKDFDDYCKQRVGLSGSYVSRKIHYEESVKTFAPGQKEILSDEKKYRALVGFRSDLQDEILTEVKKAADNGEKITAPMIERIGRSVQEIHAPRQVELPLPAILNEYTDDADDEDEDDSPPVVSNDEVLEAVGERTAEIALHPIFRSIDHHRLGRKDSKKTVAGDLGNESVRAAVEKLRDDLQAEADALDRLLKKGAA